MLKNSFDDIPKFTAQNQSHPAACPSPRAFTLLIDFFNSFPWDSHWDYVDGLAAYAVLEQSKMHTL